MGEKRTISSFSDFDFESFASDRRNGSGNSSANEASIKSCMSSTTNNKKFFRPKDTINTEYKTIARNGHWKGSCMKRTRISYVAFPEVFKKGSIADKEISGNNSPTSLSQVGCTQEKHHRPVVSLTEEDILSLEIDEESEDDDLAGVEFISDCG